MGTPHAATGLRAEALMRRAEQGRSLVAGDENGDEEPDGRNETPNERSDRNWNEMLQETRITQTGTQILSGFLLTIASSHDSRP